ncbi:MAG: hypothetical protein AAGA03_11570 [Planctomycetota bacterium]
MSTLTPDLVRRLSAREFLVGLSLAVGLWVAGSMWADEIPVDDTLPAAQVAEETESLDQDLAVFSAPQAPIARRPEYPALPIQQAEPISVDTFGLIEDIHVEPTSEISIQGDVTVHQSDPFPVTQPTPTPRVPFRRRLYGALKAALCGCDDCYRPQWHLVQSSSFWVDSARPQSRTRVRWDYGTNVILADRAEYFWARQGGRGPSAFTGQLDYHELSNYTETATGKFSTFIVTPYRSLYLGDDDHFAGFGDIQIGTKSMLVDTPLLQVTLQTTTTTPSASPSKGLGIGHVAIEPALLIGLALTERDYLQAQAAEWIPIGGDSAYEGALLRWGVAWNRIVWQEDQDNVITLNLDLVGWSFQDGSYTDPVLGQVSANNETYFYIGPGARWLLCGKFEFGVGGILALSENHFAENMIRTDLTMRF